MLTEGGESRVDVNGRNENTKCETIEILHGVRNDERNTRGKNKNS